MRITKKFYVGAASLLIAAAAFVTVLNTSGSAVTMGNRRDCGYTDVIINCGATSQAELLQKYDSNNDGRGNRDIQAIFNHYGIMRGDIAGTTSQVKRGWLNTNGVITVDGKTVATSAKSLYRVHPGKQVSPVTIAGKTYYIGPVANNYRLGADVFVFFKNGVFHAAIQSSCGNPIVATPEKPTPKPVYSCDKLTSTKIDRTRFRYTVAATAKDGAAIAHYVYDFGDGKTITTTNKTVEHTYAQPGTYTAKVTVNVSVGGVRKNVTSESCKVTIKVDEEPKQPVYKCDSLVAQKIERNRFRFTSSATAENGATISSYTYNFGDGSSNITTTNRTVEHTYAQPGSYTATLTVNFKVNGENKTATGTNCKVTIKVDEEPEKPVYKCEGLEATKINRTTYRFETDAVAEHGAEIVNYVYDFGDGSRSTTTDSAVTHEYDEAGTYTTKVTVNFRVDGQIIAINDADCKTTITVDEEPEKPVYKCENLTAQLIQNKERTYEYALTYAAEGGATLDRVVYDFGDGVSETFLPADATSVEHTYAQPGNYTTTATLYFEVPQNGETVEKRDDCEVKIEIEEEPEFCEVPGKEHLPKDSPECKEDENCPVPGKEHLPVDSPDCVEPPCEVPGKEHLPKDSPECVETPPELPKTGLDMMIGGGVGLGSLTAAGYYYASSRRNLLNALNNK